MAVNSTGATKVNFTPRNNANSMKNCVLPNMAAMLIPPIAAIKAATTRYTTDSKVLLQGDIPVWFRFDQQSKIIVIANTGAEIAATNAQADIIFVPVVNI